MLMEAVLITDTVRRGMLLNGKEGRGRTGERRSSALCRRVSAVGAVKPTLLGDKLPARFLLLSVK